MANNEDEFDQTADKVEILGSGNIALDGPFVLTVGVKFKISDGPHKGSIAIVDVALAAGKVPSEQDIVDAVKKAAEFVGPEGELLTRTEFVQDEMAERTGLRVDFAVPGPEEFRLKFD